MWDLFYVSSKGKRINPLMFSRQDRAATSEKQQLALSLRLSPAPPTPLKKRGKNGYVSKTNGNTQIGETEVVWIGSGEQSG